MAHYISNIRTAMIDIRQDTHLIGDASGRSAHRQQWPPRPCQRCAGAWLAGESQAERRLFECFPTCIHTAAAGPSASPQHLHIS